MTPKIKIILIVTAAVILLAGTAYLAMLYIFPGTTIASSLGLIPASGLGGKQVYRIEVQRAPELPQANPDADGSITEKKDNSLFVNITAEGQQTGGVTPERMGVTPDRMGVTPDRMGITVEVVVTRDTHLYRDATLDSVSKQDAIQSSIKGGKLTMIIQPMQIEDVQAGDALMAWGEKRGDRLVATDVLVIRNVQKVNPLGGAPVQ